VGAATPTERVVRLTLAYDGTRFRGWAAQRDQRTVEGVLRDALTRVCGPLPKLSVAGRTDAGVHARAQVASFRGRDDLDLERLQRSVNATLGPEVVVTDARFAPDGFDARFSASAREYAYRLDVGDWPDPFDARFVWHRPGELDLRAMRAAARTLVGEHDFGSFGRRPQGGASTVRHLARLAVARRGDRVEITARANAFLQQMVRSLVGTLVAVGEGAVLPSTMPQILAARDRAAAGRVAPPHGLTLERVVYGGRR
jgi:tRNA pseudouridine38-40 synthase